MNNTFKRGNKMKSIVIKSSTSYKMVYSEQLCLPSGKDVSGWWCMTCDIVELVYTQKVKNAVKSAKRFLLHGDLGENPSSTN